MIGPPEIAVRFCYRDDMRGFNFTREAASVSALLARLIALAETDQPAPALYAGAAAAADHLPGWADANPPRLPAPDAVPRVWIGNPTHVPTPYDVSGKLATPDERTVGQKEVRTFRTRWSQLALKKK